MSLIKVSRELIRHLVFGHSSTFYLFKGLKKGLKARDSNTKEILAKIKSKAKVIILENQQFQIDGASTGHIEFSSHLLASYTILLPEFNGDKQETINFIKDNTLAAYNNWMIKLSFRLIFWLCKKDVTKLNKVFDWMMSQYGATFTWDTLKKTDDKKEFRMTITRCFYFEFFKANNALFLMPILCQLDRIWFEMIDPKKHGFEFDKTDYQTQGYGAKVCIFPIKQIPIINSSKNKSG